LKRGVASKNKIDNNADVTPQIRGAVMDEIDNNAKQSDRLGDDLLNGGPEIAQYLNMSLREVYHLAATKRLPIGRLGRKLIASRAGLRRAAKAITSI
jgi:hypothetical protein